MATETVLTMNSHTPTPVAVDALAARLQGDLVQPSDAACATAQGPVARLYVGTGGVTR